MRFLFALALSTLLLQLSFAFVPTAVALKLSQPCPSTRQGVLGLQASVSRRVALGLGIAAGLHVYGTGGLVQAVAAVEKGTKKTGISNEELAELVKRDVEEKQFMVTGDLTRELYSEDCKFQDEIDTYALDKWIEGTQKLFKNEYSHMDLDGPVKVTDSKVEFRFKERLMFNIPYLKPKCPLTGKLELFRGSDGLFTKYKETWDQPVWKVIASLRP